MMQKVLALSVFLSSIVMSFLSFAAEQNDRPINVTMTELGKTIALLSPEIFNDAENRKMSDDQFKPLVSNLVSLIKEAKPHLDKRSVTYNISYDVMNQYLDDLTKVVNNGDTDLARGMLKSVPHLCVGCHTQDMQHNKLFTNVKRNQFENDFQFAEFNYFTRNYDTAVKYYQKYLDKLDPAIEESIRTSLKRILVIFSQIKKQPAKGAEILKQYVLITEIPKQIREDANEWVKGLNELAVSSVVDQKSLQKREDYVEYYLNQLRKHDVNYFASEKDKVFYITLRGLLYEYLNNDPSEKDVPIILYWLAVCDRTLEYSFFDNLADLYLKECILTYPTHPYARKCFKEYESYMTFAFTGSSGTHLPSDIENEIHFLKSVVNRYKKGGDTEPFPIDDPIVR